MSQGTRKELILVLGGARAGKSSFAQALAASLGPTVTLVATAEAGDEEMRRRIEEHRRARPAGWRTLEAPLQPSLALRQSDPGDVVLVDCLTLLVSNLMLAGPDVCSAERRIEKEIAGLVCAYEEGRSTFVIVSNEVGMGVVPAYQLGRSYRDLLGRANQTLAARADRVYWMLAGLPVEIKASGLAVLWEKIGASDQ